MTATLYAMPGNEGFTDLLMQHMACQRQRMFLHRFPDGETLMQLEAPEPRQPAVIVCTLDHPDNKLWPLMAAATTARELGASQVGLVAPYLAYMRQDARFHPGEAISAEIFGRWLGNTFDWLVTVDPHLHRHHRLGEIFPHALKVVHGTSALTSWIDAHVTKPLIVGPDDESNQWVLAVANVLCAPSVVAHKERKGDRDVTVQLPDLGCWREHTPVVLDDIISSGETMMQTLRCLRAQTTKQAVCIAMHGIFAEGALEGLHGEGASSILTSNTIMGDTAQIDISKLVADAVVELCATPRLAESLHQEANL